MATETKQITEFVGGTHNASLQPNGDPTYGDDSQRELHPDDKVSKIPTQKQGRKNTTKWRDATPRVVVKGRAPHLDMPWSPELTLSILAVYASNKPRKNQEFWEKIKDKWKKGKWEKPTCMLGDLNVVEDSID